MKSTSLYCHEVLLDYFMAAPRFSTCHYFQGMILPFCTYVLFSHHDHQLYLGYTTNLERRLKEHNDGKSLSTKGRRPLQLIYCEYHQSKEDAQRREKYFKTTPGKKAIKLMLRESLKALNYKKIGHSS